MILFAIWLSMLIILLIIPIVFGLLICGNYLSRFLDLNPTFEILWTEVEEGLLTLIQEKLNLFHLMVQIL